MDKDIFIIDDAKGEVKALGIKINCKPSQIHIIINGVDITEHTVISDVKISYTEGATK